MNGKHNFWTSEPVGLGNENKNISVDKKKAPNVLPPGYVFTNLESDEDLMELYKLIKKHYVTSEEEEEGVILTYSADFLRWEMNNPNHRPEYGCLLKFKPNKDSNYKIIGFILAKVHDLTVQGFDIRLVGVNYLCVHSKHRKIGLAPLLIKEIIRRAHLNNIITGIFTGGKNFFFNFSNVEYLHRPLNLKKLVEVGFLTNFYSSQINRFKLNIPKRNIRLMREDDVDQLMFLYEKEYQKYELYQRMDRETFKHAFLPRKDIVYTYVVEDKTITEFVSFFVIQHMYPVDEKSIKVAYLYYYSTDNIESLVEDVLYRLNEEGMDLVNILSMASSRKVLRNHAYLCGTGSLNYSFYNFKTCRIPPNKLFFVMY